MPPIKFTVIYPRNCHSKDVDNYNCQSAYIIIMLRLLNVGGGYGFGIGIKSAISNFHSLDGVNRLGLVYGV